MVNTSLRAARHRSEARSARDQRLTGIATSSTRRNGSRSGPATDACKLACEEKVPATDRGATAAIGTPQHSFPALRLLEEAIASLPTGAKLIVVMMPPHISAQPDTAAERADLDLCKQRIAALATSRSGYTIDFDIASAWTRNADNYWDASHFRTAIAKDFVRRVKEAIERRRDAEDGVYRYSAGPNPNRRSRPRGSAHEPISRGRTA